MRHLGEEVHLVLIKLFLLVDCKELLSLAQLLLLAVAIPQEPAARSSHHKQEIGKKSPL